MRTLETSYPFRHDDPMANLDRKRLAAHVIARRMALGIKDRRALSKETGISDRTIGKLELGQPVSPSTLGMVENVLSWEPGSAQRVLEGGEPAIKGQQSPAAPARPAYTDPVMQEAWEALEDVDLPDEVKRGMIAYARAAREDRARRVG